MYSWQQHVTIMIWPDSHALNSLVHVHFSKYGLPTFTVLSICPFFALESELISVKCNPNITTDIYHCGISMNVKMRPRMGRQPKGKKTMPSKKFVIILGSYFMSCNNMRKTYRKWIIPFLSYVCPCHSMWGIFLLLPVPLIAWIPSSNWESEMIGNIQ